MTIPDTIDTAWWAEMGVEPHPVLPLPDAEWLRGHTLEELVAFLNDRDETARAMAADPGRHGWEPPSWRLCDALLGLPWVEAEFGLKVRRTLLGRDAALKVLLINGGNRAGKTEYAARTVLRLLQHRQRAKAWTFHQSEQMSVEYQQPLLWKYLPPELKSAKGIRTGTTYLAYKQQTGFSENRFVLPNASDCSCRNYEQDPKNIQGGELDIIWCDELVPAPWIKELKARIATRGGWMLITFTPVTGYTMTVKMFVEAARLRLESIAWVLPRDGKPPRLDLALQGDNLLEALDGRPIHPPVPADREFHRVPRLMAGNDGISGVAYFHSWDNPFGNPEQLYRMHAADTTDFQKMKFYGVATKMVSNRFPLFNPLVHVIRPGQVPPGGTLYHKVDPCSGRNWAMIWIKVVRAPVGRVYYVLREWPCPGQYVPGVGDMGPWAEPGEKLDGIKGSAQNPLGWSIERYKAEIERLEAELGGRAAVCEVRNAECGTTGQRAAPTKFDKWDEDERPAPRRRRRELPGEPYERWMDSRFGAAPTTTMEGVTTLIETCEQAGLYFRPSSGKNIDEGIDLINDALFYDPERASREGGIRPDNMPRLFVEESCQNTIFALQNWTGADGQHGACKDFVDLLRYAMLDDHEDWSRDEEDTP